MIANLDRNELDVFDLRRKVRMHSLVEKQNGWVISGIKQLSRKSQLAVLVVPGDIKIWDYVQNTVLRVFAKLRETTWNKLSVSKQPNKDSVYFQSTCKANTRTTTVCSIRINAVYKTRVVHLPDHPKNLHLKSTSHRSLPLLAVTCDGHVETINTNSNKLISKIPVKSAGEPVTSVAICRGDALIVQKYRSFDFVCLQQHVVIYRMILDMPCIQITNCISDGRVIVHSVYEGAVCISWDADSVTEREQLASDDSYSQMVKRRMQRYVLLQKRSGMLSHGQAKFEKSITNKIKVKADRIRRQKRWTSRTKALLRNYVKQRIKMISLFKQIQQKHLNVISFYQSICCSARPCK